MTDQPLIAVAMPVKGRHSLVRKTILRLHLQMGVRVIVVCVGDPEDREVCEGAGAEFFEHENAPLGGKWQFAFERCRDFNPDAVLYAGSSDWFTKKWAKKLYAKAIRLERVVGMLGIYFIDIALDGFRVVWWPGYGADSDRKEETIGAGRVLPRCVLDKVDWKVFNPKLDASLDYSMERNVGKGVAVDVPEFAASISTFAWDNKHNFRSTANMGHVRCLKKQECMEVIMDKFPDAALVWEAMTGGLYHGVCALPDGRRDRGNQDREVGAMRDVRRA